MTDLSDLTAEDVRRYLRSEGWTDVGPSRYECDCTESVRRWESEGASLDICNNVACDIDGLSLWEDRTRAEVAADVRRVRDEARIPALPLDPNVDAAVEALARRHDRSGEAQPIPAAEERVVAGCESCSGYYRDLRGGNRLCVLDDEDGRYVSACSEPDTPPDWCPLRRGPVTLRLEER